MKYQRIEHREKVCLIKPYFFRRSRVRFQRGQIFLFLLCILIYIIQKDLPQTQTIMGGLCYWECRSQVDTIIILFYLCVILGIALITGLRIKKVRKFGEQAKNILTIYILILLWAVVLGFQFLYGSSIYFSVLQGHEDTDMDSYSRFYIRMDIIPGFLVQTIFLFICRLFFKGLVDITHFSAMAPWERRFMKMVTPYCYIRLIGEGTCIVLLNINAESEDVRFYLLLAIWGLILDCLITNFILLASLKVFKLHFKQNEKVMAQDYNKLKRQYIIMIITSMLRIIIDLFFLIIVPFLGILGSKECLSSFQEHSFRTIAYVGVGNFVNHLLPICWVVKIYSFSFDESTIQTDENQKYNLIQSILKSQQ